ncbi:MAG: 2-phospho-L-lactate transferase CofD family protein [bacterium]
MANIVFITGGSGARGIAREMARRKCHTAHIINVSDSGGSTRQLRLLFEKLPAIGDLRSRLIDLADRESPAYEASTALLKYRLPVDKEPAELEREWQSILKGDHRLVQAIDNEAFTRILLKELNVCETERRIVEHEQRVLFDLAKASIGNLFLAGAYFDYGQSLETAIFLYHQLANVRGDVIPATTESLTLAAKLEDGTNLVEQHVISHEKTSPSPIKELFYLDWAYPCLDAPIIPRLHKDAIAAIANADMIVFSMGSFYTSILSTLYIRGMAEAVRSNTKAVKVFTANPTEDRETVGMTTGMMAGKVIDTLRRFDSSPSTVDGDYLQRVFVGEWAGILAPGLHPISQDLAGLDLEKTSSLLKPVYDKDDLAKVVAVHYQAKTLADELMRLVA